MGTKTTSKFWAILLDNIVVALAYYFTARIGQMLAIPPGNISPVWIPSGIILAAMLFRGYHVWPGVVMGALIGNAWTYADGSSLSAFVTSILPGLANGFGDALCVVTSTYFIRKMTNVESLFNNIRSISIFIFYGAVVGPFISALFGVGSLRLAGNVEAANFLHAFITWWTGDGVGVLILTPFFLIWYTERRRKLKISRLDLLIFVVLILSSLFILGYIKEMQGIRLPVFGLAPILIWSVIRQDIRLTYTAILIVTGLAIVATALGFGIWESQELNVTLVNLQLLIAVLTMTMMYLQASVLEMQRLSSERGLLLKEIHHRVKNNLQVVSGLLILQSRTNPDPKVKTILKESQHRINSMSFIHEMLYQSDRFQMINIQEYLSTLTRYLHQSHLELDDEVNWDIRATSVALSVDTAIPLGLLITEVVTNSLKHGIRLDGKDRINIHIKPVDQDQYLLKIGDNGVGTGDKGDKKMANSLGLKLIRSLSEQLQGQIGRNYALQGTHYQMTFTDSARPLPE